MRYLGIAALAISIMGLAGALAQAPTAPAKLVFKTISGPVTFDHIAHVKRAGGSCQACHPKLFQQSAKAPLEYKGKMHKAAEANKTSCAFCHRPEGKAFPSNGNCAKCHARPAR